MDEDKSTTQLTKAHLRPVGTSFDERITFPINAFPKWALAIAGMVCALLIGNAYHQYMTTTQPSDHTFSQSDSQITIPFTVSHNWSISWSCMPNNERFAIVINGSDGSVYSGGLDTMCNTISHTGILYERVDGKVYLSIVTHGTWTIHIHNQ